ncbi:hypothetical protein A6770_35420 [Nostoc minutum NIES-26]|uniref:Low-complexity protein n=1 Tax=Nostoc minutum NIES-26 TaxID=1844469 RepID=A0A367RZK5_9NOSO|nr:hypothetical protein A6770_35420 [Nostoc minutum NIES-26]
MPEDFSYQNLRGRSFKGQDLEGANFSYADIRSCDFGGANLTDASFSYAKAGLQKRWVVLLMLVSWLLSGLSGFLWFFNGLLVSLIFQTSNLENQIAGWAALIVVIAFFILTIRQGLGIGIAALAFLVALTGAFAVAGFIARIFTTSIVFAFTIPGAFAGSGAGAGAGAFAGSVAVAIAGTVGDGTKTLARFVAEAFVVSGALIVAVIVSIAVGSSVFATTIVALPGVLFSIYIASQAMQAGEKYSLIRNLTITFAATKGTSFSGADLSNANFSQATVKSTDFRKAILTRTCFKKTKKLDRIRPGETYLHNSQLCLMLMTGQGQAQNFDRQNLQGVNLQGANLTDASFISADLSHANLQDTDLTRVKLVQTQLNGADFTGATLTGAFIEDWNITTDTKFDGVRCEYVYMRLPTPDNPDPHRKPDNRQEVFADGEFGDFIKPIFDTLDLYHNQGVDPRAIAISFKQLAENHPEADLRIVGMEVRGEDKFLLRAKTAIAADNSELSAEYFATYNQLKNLPDREIKLLLAEKENQIRRLENMVMTALERPSFYSNVEQVDFMTNNPGGFSVGGSVAGDINNVQGDNNQQRVSNKTSNFNLQNAQFGGGLVNADTVTANQIGGNIINYNPEQKQNLAQAAADIQQLLNQLSQSYPTATISERMIVVAKAVDEIENNPTLKARVIGALKAGGTEAFKELIDHPLVNILLASIDGWQEAE